ncbi:MULTISPECIES: glyoxalase superfamily protein [Chitinophagaceae]
MPTTIPIFRIFDLAKTEEFYFGWLGFRKNWEHRFDANTPVYMEVQLHDIRLHLSEHHGDCSPGARIMIEDFDDIETFHRQLIDKNYRYNRPGLEDAFWDPNIKVLEVIDPFGNRITFTGKADLKFKNV